MRRVQNICMHPLWQECVRGIAQQEQDRIFCRHDVQHFLDVARLAYVEVLERKLDIPKELIYGAALVHDIGRYRQYLDGTPHDEAGAWMAEKILPECGFDAEQTAGIVRAISHHRSSENAEDAGLSGILYRADKASRVCQFCKAQEQCNWPATKKNMTLKG